MKKRKKRKKKKIAKKFAKKIAKNCKKKLEKISYYSSKSHKRVLGTHGRTEGQMNLGSHLSPSWGLKISPCLMK